MHGYALCRMNEGTATCDERVEPNRSSSQRKVTVYRCTVLYINSTRFDYSRRRQIARNSSKSTCPSPSLSATATTCSQSLRERSKPSATRRATFNSSTSSVPSPLVSNVLKIDLSASSVWSPHAASCRVVRKTRARERTSEVASAQLKSHAWPASHGKHK